MDNKNHELECLKNVLNMIPADLFQETDISTLTETYVTSDRVTNVPNHYNVHAYAKRNELGRLSGDVLCLIKAHLAPFKIIHKEDNVKALSTKACMVISAYFNPTTKDLEIIDTLSNVFGKIQSEEAKNIILQGDFNCRIDKPSCKTKAALEFLQEEGFQLQSNDISTYMCHNGKSTVDLTFTRNMLVHNQQVLENNNGALIRKHRPVKMKMGRKDILDLKSRQKREDKKQWKLHQD